VFTANYITLTLNFFISFIFFEKGSQKINLFKTFYIFNFFVKILYKKADASKMTHLLFYIFIGQGYFVK